ncbi:uncharacterized protein G2W53_014291 [Senna tora]|uniref:Uncharacterized protein n=1 Tax=Senna tora TaxID=362788 RepID=A0A834WTA0_9FABA|nr:uncharacterized protein G2W53_014291 [Senna tora]
MTRQKTCCASESKTSVRVIFVNRSGFDAPIGVVMAWEERGSCVNIFRTTSRGWISKIFTNYKAKDLLRKSVDHVLTYSVQQITLGSQKPSRITRQKTCCASESKTSVHVVFANRSGFDAPIGVVMAWEECRSCLNIFRMTNRVANQSGFDGPIGVVLAWEERGSCVNVFRTKNRGQISEIFMNYEAKDMLRNESKTSVRVIFVNRSGFDAPIGVVMAWEERGSCVNIFRTTSRGWISKIFTNYKAKDLLRKNLHELRGKRLVAQVSQRRRFPLYLRTGVVLMLQLESSWHGRSVDHVLTYSRRQIIVGSQKPSRITRQKTCCASVSNTSVRVVFANRSGFDAPIGVVLAREECGSCLNIFWMTNCARISETFMNYEAKDLLRKKLHELRGKRLGAQLKWHGRNVDHVLTYSGLEITVGSQKPSRITRQKTCCASESKTSVRVVFANWSGFDAPIGVVLAWEERGSRFNIFQMTNRGQILETFTNYESSWHGRSVDLVLTYSGRKIAVKSQKPSRITRQRTCCASESNTSVRVVFANWSGFDALIRVVLPWEERGSCLNILRTRNRGRISETFTNYEAKDLLRKSVDHVLIYSGWQIVVGSQKASRITRQKSCCAIDMAWEERESCIDIFQMKNRGRISETFTNYEAKDLLCKCVKDVGESNTSVSVVFANQSGSDAPIAVDMAWEERGSCLNIFRTTNRGRISETFTNYEVKDSLRKSVDHVLIYFGWQITVGSQKASRIMRQKTCCASESKTSVRVVFANRSGFDAPIGVFLAWEERESNTSVSVVFANRSGSDAPIAVDMAWEERGSCINILRTTNRGRISETFTNYEAKDLLRKSVDHVLIYSGWQIMGGSQKASRITRQKTCCASESNTSVRVVFANRSGFDAPVGVFLAWEERESCLHIFRMKNRGRISETFTNYEAKVILRNRRCMGGAWIMYYHIPNVKSQSDLRNLHELRGKRLVAQVDMAWEERGSRINIFRTTNHGRISETFTNYEAKDLLCNESKTSSVRVVFANRSGFDAPIGVILAWEERVSCVNIFWTTNRGRISETFTNYEAKTCCATESNTSVCVVFANRSGFDAPIGVFTAWE